MQRVSQSIAITLLLFFTWQLLVWTLQLPNYILPTPYETLLQLKLSSHLLLHESGITILETVIGLLLGVICGIIASIIITLVKPLRFWLLPILIISQAIPTFAIAPLIVLWFGYGVASKIITTIIMIFFPITSALYDGLKRVNPDWLDLAKTMNTSPWRTFWHIQFPAALPALAAGIRIATVAAPIGAIVGEWVGASHGLGNLMLNANARMQIDMMFAALLIIIVFSLLLYSTIDYLLNKLVWWN